MNTWNSIAWGPICVGLTAAGLVFSWFTWRRRGLRRGIRTGAWSLLPLALYLTGSIVLVGRIGSAVVQFAQSFAFSPKTWSGVVLLGLSALILLASGGIPGRKRAKSRELEQRSQSARAAAPDGNSVPVPAGRGDRATSATGTVAVRPARSTTGSKDDDDDGLDADVVEILRRRGIR